MQVQQGMQQQNIHPQRFPTGYFSSNQGSTLPSVTPSAQNSPPLQAARAPAAMHQYFPVSAADGGFQPPYVRSTWQTPASHPGQAAQQRIAQPVYIDQSVYATPAQVPGFGYMGAARTPGHHTPMQTQQHVSSVPHTPYNEPRTPYNEPQPVSMPTAPPNARNAPREHAYARMAPQMKRPGHGVYQPVTQQIHTQQQYAPLHHFTSTNESPQVMSPQRSGPIPNRRGAPPDTFQQYTAAVNDNVCEICRQCLLRLCACAEAAFSGCSFLMRAPWFFAGEQCVATVHTI